MLLIWIIVGQGSTALAAGTVLYTWTFFSRLSFLSSFLHYLGDSPKHCLKGPKNPKQPTNHPRGHEGPYYLMVDASSREFVRRVSHLMSARITSVSVRTGCPLATLTFPIRLILSRDIATAYRDR